MIPAPRAETSVRLHFTIFGAPRTKKNHGWRTKQGAQMPSHAFAAWNKSAQWDLMIARRTPLFETFKEPVNCRALFYRERSTGDAVGYFQALADALQEGRIVEDDRLIVSWDGSRLLKDTANPRIEVTLERV